MEGKRLVEQSEEMKEGEFVRMYGVRKEIWEEMSEIVRKELKSGGRPLKLCSKGQVLVTLMYWREYRTMFQIAQSIEVGEATVYRMIQRVEEALAKDGRYKLRGIKAEELGEQHVVIVDATEQSIERPKKKRSSGSITVGRRKPRPTKYSLL